MFNLFKKSKVKQARSAGIYQHPTELIFYAQWQSQAGFCLASDPVIRLPRSSKAEDIGRSLRVVLEAFRDNVPDSTDWKELRAQFLRATRFKSWKSLEGPAKSCWIEESAGFITFTPLRNGGSRGDEKGFQPFGKEPVRVPASFSNEELGEVLLETLSHCE